MRCVKMSKTKGVKLTLDERKDLVNFFLDNEGMSIRKMADLKGITYQCFFSATRTKWWPELLEIERQKRLPIPEPVVDEPKEEIKEKKIDTMLFEKVLRDVLNIDTSDGYTDIYITAKKRQEN